MLYFYRISINNFYIIKRLTLSHKISKLLQKFCLVFCYCLHSRTKVYLLALASIFVPSIKMVSPGNFAHIKQCIRHFCKDTFRTGSKMEYF